MCQSTSPYAETRAANHCNRKISLQIKKHQLITETHERSINYTSTPTTTSRTVTNDWEKLIWTVSSLVSRGIFRSRIRQCNFVISRAHKNIPRHSFLKSFQPSSTNRNDLSLKRTETQENVKFHFKAPPMLVQELPPTIFCSFLFQFIPQNQNSSFTKFCSTAVGLLSSRSNCVSNCKETRNLLQKIFGSD